MDFYKGRNLKLLSVSSVLLSGVQIMKHIQRQILNTGFRFTALLVGVAALSACGKKKTDLDSDQAYLVADSAVSSVNGSLNDSEQANSYALIKPVFEIIPTAYAASCGISRFSPSVGNNCNATSGMRAVTANFASCTAGRSDEINLNGQVALTFDSNATCNTWLAGAGLPTSGSVTRTTTNFTRTNPNGSVVSVSSASHTNYAGTTVGGGVTTTFGAGTRTVVINGLQRTRVSATGVTVFDHSVTTTAPIVTTGTRLSGTRTVSSGTIKVDHNRAKFSSTANLSGLTWNASCCHPVSGTVTFALSGTDSGSLVIDYGTGSCGSAAITKSGTFVGNVDLPGCE